MVNLTSIIIYTMSYSILQIILHETCANKLLQSYSNLQHTQKLLHVLKCYGKIITIHYVI